MIKEKNLLIYAHYYIPDTASTIFPLKNTHPKVADGEKNVEKVVKVVSIKDWRK